MLIHRKFHPPGHWLLRTRTPVRNHIHTRERKRYRARFSNLPLGAGSRSKAVFHRTEVLRVLLQSRRLQAALSGDRTDSAVPVRGLRQVFRYGTAPQGPGNRRRWHCIGQDCAHSPKRAPNGRWIEDGWIRLAVKGSCSGNGAGPTRCGDVSPRTLPRRTDPGSVVLASTSLTAPGASGVSSRDTLRRS